MKKCPRCHKTQPLTDFHRDSTRPDGYHAYCKHCRKALDQAYRDTHPQTPLNISPEKLARDRARKAKHYHAHKAQYDERKKRVRETQPEQLRAVCVINKRVARGNLT